MVTRDIKRLTVRPKNFVRSKSVSLKYQRFTPSGGKNIGIRKSEFVPKTQFLTVV